MAEAAGGETVARALAPLVLVFGLGDQATAPQFWKVYADALGDLPRIALDRAAAEWPKVGKFFPKPAEVRELALPHALAFRQAAYRAKKATEAPPAPPKPAERMPREKFDALMADFNRQIADIQTRSVLDRTKNREVRPPQAKTDHTGMSPEMRAVIEQQRA